MKVTARNIQSFTFEAIGTLSESGQDIDACGCHSRKRTFWIIKACLFHQIDLFFQITIHPCSVKPLKTSEYLFISSEYYARYIPLVFGICPGIMAENINIIDQFRRHSRLIFIDSLFFGVRIKILPIVLGAVKTRYYAVASCLAMTKGI